MQDKVEKLSVADGLRAVRFAEVVVVLLDAAIPFEQQDLRIADLAEREGRAVVVALNKWDLETHKQQKLRELRAEFERLLPQLRGAPLVTVSAKTGHGMDRLRAAVEGAHDGLEPAGQHRPAQPLAGGHGRRAPAARAGRAADPAALHDAGQDPAAGFVVMCSHPEKLPESYRATWWEGCATISTCPARRSG